MKFYFYNYRGARHGIKMNGKLARIMEQELKMNSKCEQNDEVNIEIKKKKKKRKHIENENEEDKEDEKNINVTSNDIFDNNIKNKSKKNKKNKKLDEES